MGEGCWTVSLYPIVVLCDLSILLCPRSGAFVACFSCIAVCMSGLDVSCWLLVLLLMDVCRCSVIGLVAVLLSNQQTHANKTTHSYAFSSPLRILSEQNRV